MGEEDNKGSWKEHLDFSCTGKKVDCSFLEKPRRLFERCKKIVPNEKTVFIFSWNDLEISVREREQILLRTYSLDTFYANEFLSVEYNIDKRKTR